MPAELQSISVNAPFKGLSSVYPQTQVELRYQTFLERFWVRNGVLSATPQFGIHPQLRTLPRGEKGVTHFAVYDFGAIPYLVALGTKRGFFWTGSEWSCISPFYEEGTFSCTAGSTIITGVGTRWMANVKRGDIFWTVGAVGTELVREVHRVISDTTIEVAKPSFPDTHRDIPYKIYDSFMGNEWDSVNYGGWIVFTNTIDGMWRWTVGGFLQRIVPEYKPRYITAYKERLVGMCLVEAGYDAFNRVRWSDVGSTDVWDPLNFADLVDTPGKIETYTHIGDTLYIFKEKSTVSTVYVGGIVVFGFSVVLEGFGALKALSHENIAYCWNKESFFVFDGSRWPENVGAPIVNKLRDAFDKDVFMLALPHYNHIVLFGKNQILCYNYEEKAWGSISSEKSPIVPFICGVLWKRVKVTSWDEVSPSWDSGVGNSWDTLTGTWDALGGTWDTLVGAVQMLPSWNEYIQVAERDSVLVAEKGSRAIDELRYTDFSSTFELHTVDFKIDPDEHGVREGRFLWFFVECVGIGSINETPLMLYVSYSIDHGENWKFLGQTELFFGVVEKTTVYNLRFPFDAVGAFIAIRIYIYRWGGETAGVEIRQLGLQFVPSSLWGLKETGGV